LSLVFVTIERVLNTVLHIGTALMEATLPNFFLFDFTKSASLHSPYGLSESLLFL